MTLIIKVAEDKLESVRAVLAQTDGVEAVTEQAVDEVRDWDDDEEDDDGEWVPRTREERIRDIKHAIQEVNAHRAGKIELPLAKDVLREL